ncbi:MAG: HAMP domain-containing histidine kinase [Clostridiaceae bacterium]|jgi:two-component system phosphate regulon sensor histidine kinase PhoR|nr:HAMP domain-containing histidine kinase [Clostridiaceae bacterium]
MRNANALYKLDANKILASEYPLQQTPEKNSLSASSRDFCPTDEMFLNNIAHELRTPINVVLGSIQLFEMMGDDLFLLYNRNKFKVYNNIMKQNCYRLLRAVNNLIDISRIESGSFCLFLANHDIVDIVNEIIKNAKVYAAKKGITLKFNSANKEILTAFDEDKISRVILNLLSNAIKFTPDGGSISVSIRANAEKVYISVKDTGIGIPADQLDNIFKRYVQVEKTLSKNYEGGGIGLFLADSIVRLHEGTISVKSSPEKGSTFTIELPVKKIDKIQSKKELGSELNLSPAETVKIELSDLY